MGRTKTTAKPDPLTEPASPLSLPPPLRRRSLRLSPAPNSEPPAATRVSTAKGKKNPKTMSSNGDEDGNKIGKGFLNLRSGKKVLKRGETTTTTTTAADDDDDDSLGSSKKRKIEEEEQTDEGGNDELTAGKSHVDDEGEGEGEGESSQRKPPPLSREEKGKTILVVENKEEEDEESIMEVNNFVINDSPVSVPIPVPVPVPEQARNSAAARENGARRNEVMERFRDIARENASRFAHFASDGEDDDGDRSSVEPEEELENEDWPGPFSTAIRIIRDRENKGDIQTGFAASSQASLIDSIKWVPRTTSSEEREDATARFNVPSLQEMCLQILSRNVDAIVSLESVPDALRHRLSHLLCDSRRINDHFLELLVGGAPTEIRLRDCSWLSEEHFTKCFQTCDTTNLLVLQLDQCGRSLADYVIVATLAQSPRQLPRLVSLSVSGACRLSNVGLRALISSAPELRSLNLNLCSLLTSDSIDIIAESLKSVLKELYLDDCQGMSAALVVPALVKLEHLEVLSVAGIQTFSDKILKDYIIARGHNLKELVLKGCINLTDRSIKVIAEHCPGLCVLDLMNLGKLTDLSIGYLTKGCRSLHTLKLCRNPFSDEAIGAFVETSGESLKELSLNNIKKVGYHTAISLARHAKNLHTLDLSWCRNLSDNALGFIVDSCLSLKLLKLFGCTQVTDVFVKGHSNMQIQIIGLKMSPVLQHVKVPDPHQAALNYSSVTVDLV
ncbi:uncharacterized protein LOC130722188 [Lotus japonicus]|uniref:uncharacterized protein LOC130722188 n=1 Tax=Lotus japonicus TaxID=34305 RepID=UPI002591192C|nr:uncharacterized protein LOC130722188 [Lotus japonicus]